MGSLPHRRAGEGEKGVVCVWGRVVGTYTGRARVEGGKVKAGRMWGWGKIQEPKGSHTGCVGRGGCGGGAWEGVMGQRQVVVGTRCGNWHMGKWYVGWEGKWGCVACQRVG